MGPERFVNIFAVEKVNGELQTLSYQRREEEEAEGDDLEHEELPRHVNAGVARRLVLEAALSRRRQGQTHEDGDGEERVDVDQTVQSGDMDAGR